MEHPTRPRGGTRKAGIHERPPSSAHTVVTAVCNQGGRALVSTAQSLPRHLPENERGNQERRGGRKLGSQARRSQEKSLSPSVITQSEPAEAAEMTYCWESL